MAKKRRIVALVAIVLCIALLTSCTPFSEGGDGKLELTVWNTQGTDYVYKDLNEDIPSEWLAEKSGVRVQNIYGNDGGQWDSKLTKLVTGNNLPDIIWCEAKQGPSHFNKINALGKLALLTDEMLKQYAPNIWKRTPEYIWDQFRTEDGKIVGIPFEIDVSELETVFYDYTEEELADLRNISVVPTSGVITQLSIRDDVLKMIYPEAKSYDEIMTLVEETGEPIGEELFDVPINTTGEFIDFMYKIRDLNLKEDGKSVYAFGYAGDGNDNWEAFCYLGNMMFGGGEHQYTAHWNNVKEKIEVPLVTDYVKQMAKEQNKMIHDKVIDPESLAHTAAQFQAKIFQGRYAICATNRAGSFDTVNNQIKETGKNFQYRPLYINIPAPEGYEPNKVVYSFGSSFCILNTLSEEEVIKVLKWADLQYTDEFMEIYNWGTKEDGLYTDNEDGSRTFKDDKFNKFFMDSDTSALEVNESKGLGGQGKRFIIRPFANTKWSHKVYNKIDKLVPSTISAFRFKSDSEYVKRVKAAPPCTAYASEFGDINEVVDYWARREEWEIAIKKAIAAPDGEFETKWNDMLGVLENIVDIEKMETEMTKVALKYWENIKAGVR